MVVLVPLELFETGGQLAVGGDEVFGEFFRGVVFGDGVDECRESFFYPVEAGVEVFVHFVVVFRCRWETACRRS